MLDEFNSCFKLLVYIFQIHIRVPIYMGKKQKGIWSVEGIRLITIAMSQYLAVLQKCVQTNARGTFKYVGLGAERDG